MEEAMGAAVQIDDRDHRSPRMLRCEIIDPVGHSYSCLLKNISRHGLGGSGATRLLAGQRVTIVIPELATLTGSVRWAAGGKFGIHLDQEIVPELVVFVAPKNDAAPQFRVAEHHEPLEVWRGPRH
jgi:hypothetical protein